MSRAPRKLQTGQQEEALAACWQESYTNGSKAKRILLPVRHLREWIERNLGPVGRIQGAMLGAGELGRVVASLPAIATRAVTVLEQLETMTLEGLTLSQETIAAMGRTEGRKSRWRALALWIIALTFIGILFAIRQL